MKCRLRSEMLRVSFCASFGSFVICEGATTSADSEEHRAGSLFHVGLALSLTSWVKPLV